MAEQRVTLRGEIDISNVDKIRASLDYAVATGSDVVVDCAELTFIDSVGIKALIDASLILARRNRALDLVNLPRSTRRVLDLVSLAEVLHYDRVDA